MSDAIITEILKREGWDAYTNNPADRGGPTKWGITLKAWEEYVDHPCTEDDIKAISEGQARDFYQEIYITEPGFHQIENEHVRELIIDCGVNHGPVRAAKWLQRSLMVRKDGYLGPITFGVLENTDPLEVFLETLAYRIKLYGRLVSRDHSQAVFAAGWNNRAAGFLEQAGNRLAEGQSAV